MIAVDAFTNAMRLLSLLLFVGLLLWLSFSVRRKPRRPKIRHLPGTWGRAIYRECKKCEHRP